VLKQISHFARKLFFYVPNVVSEVETYEITVASYLTGVKRALLRGQNTM
jgi:hypothetical protein